MRDIGDVLRARGRIGPALNIEIAGGRIAPRHHHHRGRLGHRRRRRRHHRHHRHYHNHLLFFLIFVLPLLLLLFVSAECRCFVIPPVPRQTSKAKAKAEQADKVQFDRATNATGGFPIFSIYLLFLTSELKCVFEWYDEEEEDDSMEEEVLADAFLQSQSATAPSAPDAEANAE